MLKSLRRVANTLLVVSVLSMSLSVLSSLSINCGAGGEGCVAQLLGGFDISSVETDTSFNQSTPLTIEGGQTFTLAGLNTFVQLTSMYILLLAVIILVTLECLELHYIRMLMKKRKAFVFKF